MAESETSGNVFLRSAYFVIQAVILGLIVWVCNTVLELRDRSLEQKYVNINQDLRNGQMTKEASDIREELKAMRIQVGAIATNTASAAAQAAIAAQAAQDARPKR